jgi:Copper binding proteins, plastocyanin/azurin family
VKPWRIALLTLCVSIGLGVAACGDDDETATPAATETVSAETTDTAEGETTETAGGGATLEGSVGPGFDISLDGTDGLTAGSYTIVVNDQSSAHNFHLTGPGGVDVATDVGEEGEETFEVDLQSGEYTFICDPHASQMRGSFTVG